MLSAWLMQAGKQKAPNELSLILTNIDKLSTRFYITIIIKGSNKKITFLDIKSEYKKQMAAAHTQRRPIHYIYFLLGNPQLWL